MKHSEKEIERLRDENKKLREIISDETNPDKQLIFMLEIQLEDCKRWLKDKDRKIMELENKMEYSKEELEIIQIAVIEAINNVIYIGIEGGKYDNDLRIVLAKTRCNLECIEESENKYIKGE